MPCQGKTLSVRNTKGESTDGHDGGGSSGRSDEALVMSVERSGCSKTAVANRAIGKSNRFQRRLSSQGGREMAGTSRVNREVYARFCGRLEVKSLRPTRRARQQADQGALHGAERVGHVDLLGMDVVTAAVINDVLGGAGQHRRQVQRQDLGVEVLVDRQG